MHSGDETFLQEALKVHMHVFFIALTLLLPDKFASTSIRHGFNVVVPLCRYRQNDA